MSSQVAEELLRRVDLSYRAAADPARAAGMRRYMRDLFPFHGIATPERRRLDAEARRGLPVPSEAELVELTSACWRRDEREHQYFGCDEVRRAIGGCGPSFLAHLEVLVTTKAWWDTVDVLCRHGVGELVRRHPGLQPEVDRWLASDDTWLIRSAILHMERWGEGTDVPWLLAACRARADHPDFFVRKAIGWALRTLAHRDPEVVRRFLAEHGDELSPLSRREAVKRTALEAAG